MPSPDASHVIREKRQLAAFLATQAAEIDRDLQGLRDNPGKNSTAIQRLRSERITLERDGHKLRLEIAAVEDEAAAARAMTIDPDGVRRALEERFRALPDELLELAVEVYLDRHAGRVALTRAEPSE